jgi:nicotinamide phosphoribosyltransferase
MSDLFKGTRENFILLTDSYKPSHYKLLPPKTTKVYAYAESRGVSDPGVPSRTLFFGLQAWLKRYFVGPVFDEADINEADGFYPNIYPTPVFNRQLWVDLLRDHPEGLPLRIKALPEGSLVDSRNALVTIENTDPKYAWLVTYVETLLLEGIWYPTTVATTSFSIKQLIRKYAQQTGGNMEIPVHLNDFGFRGVSSPEQAGMGGMAHLVNFLGSDNQAGMIYAIRYYNAKPGVGVSVPATEHSETIMWGEDHEADAYRYFLEQYPEGILSMVIDSYDDYNAVDNILGKELHDVIVNRNGKLVVRPDSGYPPDKVVQLLKSLDKNFGSTVNDKGYKNLNPKVGMIYGDWMHYAMIDRMYGSMAKHGFCTDNVVAGQGGALLQKLDRDTYKFALKDSYAEIDGKEVAFCKHPKADSSKNSKAGKLQVEFNKWTGKFTTHSFDELREDHNVLRTVFENGELKVDETFETIRKRADSFLNVV